MKRAVRGVFVTVSAVLLGLSLVGWAASEHYLSGLSKVDVFGGLGGGPGWSGQPINVLLVGSDDRTGLSEKQRNRLRTGHEDYGRHTDTMMLLHLGEDLDNVSIVSIPRDSLVTIPAHTSPEGEPLPERQGKINSAFATGGPKTTVAAVQQATGVTVDHYVEVNFQGFLNMVDAVEGVPVCLPEPLYDERSGLDLPAGQQTIKGKQALAYVRARYIDNDFGRAQRQQKFVAAMVQKVTGSGTLLNPLALNSFVDAATSSVTTDERLGRDDVAALAARVADVELGKIQFTTVPVSDGSHIYNGESTVLWDDTAAKELFASLIADEPLPKPEKAKVVEVSPGDISATVSGSTAEQAANGLSDLQGAGIQATASGAPATGSTQTVVKYDPVWAQSLATVQAMLPDALYQEVPGMGGVFAIDVGSEYSGVDAVRSASTSVERTVRAANDDICVG
ncbi:LCP family protein [Candidatus Nanopelagicales bacterium]|nr:LCP family protein [Candidatus Nanopelagicales bacterium]